VAPPAGAPDLDTRTSGPTRDEVGYDTARCSGCGFASDAWLRLEFGLDAARARAIVGSTPFQACAGTGPTTAAQRAECRAVLARAAGHHQAAGWLLLHAAWTCDDDARRDDARRYRLAAVASWRDAIAAGLPLLPDDESRSAPVLVAETLRRAGAFADAAATARAALPEARGPIEAALRFIAERSWAGDDENATLPTATEPRPGHPETRLVPPLPRPTERVWMQEFPEGDLELRRGATGSAWLVRGAAGARQQSVLEAVVWASAQERGGFTEGVLAATSAELAFWGDHGRSPAVLALGDELGTARQRWRHGAVARVVGYRELWRALDALTATDAPILEVLVRTPEPMHAIVISTAVDCLIRGLGVDGELVIGTPDDGIRVRNVRSHPTILVHADDGGGAAGPRLHELGWRRRAATGGEGTLVREEERSGSPYELAALIARALHLAYGVAADADLAIRVAALTATPA
jgi:hypothetical protein